MVQHIFKLMFLLWVWDRPNGGNSAHLNMNFSYHKSPHTVYSRHPVQVLCMSLHSESGHLELKISSFDNESKNSSTVQGNYVVSGKVSVLNAMDKMVTRFLPGNSPIAELFNDSAVFKFCVSNAFQYGGVIRCTAVEPNENPPHLSMKRKFDFKYEPTKPALKVFYHLKPAVAIEGETLLVSCSAYVGSTESGRLVLTSASDELFRPWVVSWIGPDRENPYGDVTARKEMTDKGPRIYAMFHLETTLTLNGSLFVCRSTDLPDQDSIDTHGVSMITSATHPLVVKVYPYRPQLSVTSTINENIDYNPHGGTWILEGSCQTPEIYARDLSMVFKTNHKSFVFSVTDDSLETKRTSFQNDFGGHTTGTVYKVNFWIVKKKDKVSSFIKAYMDKSIQEANVSCRVRDLQRCQSFLSNDAVRILAFKKDDCVDTNASKEELKSFLLRTVAFVVLILCAGLFVVVIVQEIIKKLVD